MLLDTNEASRSLGIVSVILSVLTNLALDTKILIQKKQKQLDCNLFSTSDLPIASLPLSSAPLPLSTTALPPSTSDIAVVHVSSFFSSLGKDNIIEFLVEIFLSVQTYSAIIQNKEVQLHVVKCSTSLYYFYVHGETGNKNENNNEIANYDKSIYYKDRARRINFINETFGIRIHELKKSIFDRDGSSSDSQNNQNMLNTSVIAISSIVRSWFHWSYFLSYSNMKTRNKVRTFSLYPHFCFIFHVCIVDL